ncbi:MAG: class I SAM-dependent methyltransferase [Candidatus Peribacteria bacterium]|nr:MAG: class I SAM-dependent methyltransferase [Candidatus Peribacteria bacterium]
MLDFGCGKKPYQSLFDYEQYVGVDIEVSGHDNSQHEVDYFWDGETLPFADESFDSILASEVFEHVFELDAVLDELSRVLKPGGFLVSTTPFCIHEHEQPYDFARYTSFGLQYLYEKHGFTVIQNEQYGSYASVILQLCIWRRGKVLDV